MWRAPALARVTLPGWKSSSLALSRCACTYLLHSGHSFPPCAHPPVSLSSSKPTAWETGRTRCRQFRNLRLGLLRITGTTLKKRERLGGP